MRRQEQHTTDDIRPAFVVHCSDILNRKLYFIHVFQRPSPTPTPTSIIGKSFKVIDENDNEIKTIGLLNLQFSDVSKTYNAIVNTEGGVIPLTIIGIQPWLSKN
tara:strand:- start:1062 stop:1373 length:312 start_codon:yes stop_codon:yes gene_type:complete